MNIFSLSVIHPTKYLLRSEIQERDSKDVVTSCEKIGGSLTAELVAVGSDRVDGQAQVRRTDTRRNRMRNFAI